MLDCKSKNCVIIYFLSINIHYFYIQTQQTISKYGVINFLTTFQKELDLNNQQINTVDNKLKQDSYTIEEFNTLNSTLSNNIKELITNNIYLINNNIVDIVRCFPEFKTMDVVSIMQKLSAYIKPEDNQETIYKCVRTIFLMCQKIGTEKPSTITLGFENTMKAIQKHNWFPKIFVPSSDADSHLVGISKLEKHIATFQDAITFLACIEKHFIKELPVGIYNCTEVANKIATKLNNGTEDSNLFWRVMETLLIPNYESINSIANELATKLASTYSKQDIYNPFSMYHGSICKLLMGVLESEFSIKFNPKMPNGDHTNIKALSTFIEDARTDSATKKLISNIVNQNPITGEQEKRLTLKELIKQIPQKRELFNTAF